MLSKKYFQNRVEGIIKRLITKNRTFLLVLEGDQGPFYSLVYSLQLSQFFELSSISAADRQKSHLALHISVRPLRSDDGGILQTPPTSGVTLWEQGLLPMVRVIPWLWNSLPTEATWRRLCYPFVGF